MHFTGSLIAPQWDYYLVQQEGTTFNNTLHFNALVQYWFEMKIVYLISSTTAWNIRVYLAFFPIQTLNEPNVYYLKGNKGIHEDQTCMTRDWDYNCKWCIRWKRTPVLFKKGIKKEKIMAGNKRLLKAYELFPLHKEASVESAGLLFLWVVTGEPFSSVLYFWNTSLEGNDRYFSPNI